MTGSISERPAARTSFRLVSLLLTVCLLAAPALGLVSKGQKNYKRGLEYEASQQWEKAAEEFSLAVAAEPANSEYQLHYRRAVFNASQVFSQQGAALMERGDYLGAYNAFRRAYAYDQANELARSMMERAFRLQTNKQDDAEERAPVARPQASARLAPTSYDSSAPTVPAGLRDSGRRQEDSLPSTRNEQLHAIQYSGDLEQFIKYLARQIKINVVFDRDFPKREVNVDLVDVTAAQALDYVFLTQGLFFQKLSSRTIVVAEQVKRPQYQQLVLRTFYLYNVDPNDARSLITASIPPQAGRQPVITVNKSTNSITVRDTPENVRLVSDLLRSIDKERAEVVMDVNIFEVSREDLLQFGNQIGTGDSLMNLGGIQKGLSVLGGSRQVVTQALSSIPTALGAAFIVPPTALSALQRRDNTRLVASTQVHAFDGEKSTAHIGQRVPVQTATVAPYGAVTSGGDNNQPGVAQGLFGGNGYPVIQYEKTGLTLEFTPQVFPNLDVQVKMSIKSNDVTQTSGGPALTPTFTERNIEGTARIQNNRTMMIASVAQNSQSKGRQGLPVLGLVPVLGQMFTAPRRNNSQTDIVIAVTPHVMRASSVTPEDEEMHPSGTLQTPTGGTLEAMLLEVGRDEQLAAARAVPTHAQVELPEAPADQAPAELAVSKSETAPATRQVSYVTNRPAPAAPKVEPAAARVENDATTNDTTAVVSTADEVTFVPAPKQLMSAAAAEPVATPAPTRPATRDAALSAPAVSAPAESPKLVPGNSLFSFEKTKSNATVNNPTAPTARPSSSNSATEFPVSYITEKPLTDRAAAVASSAAALRLMSDPQALRVGERRQLKLLLKTDAPLGLLALSFRLDPRLLAVRAIGAGTLAGTDDTRVTHSVTPAGVLLVTVSPARADAAVTGAGVLLTLEVEALAPGAEPLRFDADDVYLVATDGRKVLVKVMTDQLSVR
ncbi:MAG TPA: secretin N-terminal domain-containing protein [Pyrinomonadaceae bacterium]|nr:secretin N-terminal domain-containing protein [Pyrinomonadaceae bacterium]